MGSKGVGISMGSKGVGGSISMGSKGVNISMGSKGVGGRWICLTNRWNIAREFGSAIL